MITTHPRLRVGALAAAAVLGVTGLGTVAAAAAPAGPTAGKATPTSAQPAAAQKNREIGNLIEGTATLEAGRVFATLYDNSAHGNSIQVIFDDDGPGGGRAVKKLLVDGQSVYGVVKVDGKRVVIKGTARRVGKRIPIHEEFDDGDQKVSMHGFQRRLALDLTLRYDGERVPLTSDNAFHYNLKVTKESNS